MAWSGEPRPDWEKLLKAKYNSFHVEVEAYLNSLEIATSTEISMANIYHAIKNDQNVSANLKALYREVLFGTIKEVKARIKN